MGSLSYITLPRESAPDVNIPLILITTSQEGISPEDIENTITKEIEKQLTGLKGMKDDEAAPILGALLAFMISNAD